MATEDTHLLLTFYLGTGTDHMGRRLDEIMKKDNIWLERTHDYIQWIFPLYVGSRFNSCAPLLTNEIRRIFLDAEHPHSPSLNANLSTAIQLMLQFYGYIWTPETDSVIQAPLKWSERTNNWLTENNHNHLRITRILRCMTLLGRHKVALTFHHALVDSIKQRSKCVTPSTLAFWEEAVTLPRPR
jgi:hypothetical protein